MRKYKDFPGTQGKRDLLPFKGFDFVKKVPESFQAYCQAAVQGARQQAGTLSHKGAVARVYVMNTMELAINDFLEQSPNYSGAHLILTMAPKVRTYIPICQY